MVTENNGRNRRWKGYGTDDVGANLRVRANCLKFLGRQGPGLAENVAGHRKLADIVQNRCNFNALDLTLTQAELTGQSCCEPPHSSYVRFRLAVLCVDRNR